MKIISLGMGVQSTTLYYMSSMGILPRVDYAIFADPGAESLETYKYLEFLKNWKQENNGVTIIHDQTQNILRDIRKKENSTGQKFVTLPLYTVNNDGTKGMLRRQCTNEYKIKIVNKNIRQLYGLQPRQRTPKTEVWIGITLDEVERIKDAKEVWKSNKYPFVDKNYLPKYYTRQDCKDWLTLHGLPIPPKSACNFCPFQGDRRLREKKLNHPEEWEVIVEVDKISRDSTQKGDKQKAYLHNSCQPIDKVYLQEDQLNAFINECEGYCGI